MFEGLIEAVRNYRHGLRSRRPQVVQGITEMGTSKLVGTINELRATVETLQKVVEACARELSTPICPSVPSSAAEAYGFVEMDEPIIPLKIGMPLYEGKSGRVNVAELIGVQVARLMTWDDDQAVVVALRDGRVCFYQRHLFPPPSFENTLYLDRALTVRL